MTVINQPAIETSVPSKRFYLQNIVIGQTESFFPIYAYNYELMQSLVDKINEHKSFVVANLNNTPISQIAGSVTIPAEYTVMPTTTYSYDSSGQQYNVITAIDLTNAPSSSLNQFSATFNLPLSNNEIASITGYRVSEFEFIKRINNGLKFIFPDNSVIQLPTPTVASNTPVLELHEIKPGSWFIINKDALDTISPLSANDELDFVITTQNVSGAGGISTPVETPYSATYSNNDVIDGWPYTYGTISVEANYISLSGVLALNDIGQALSAYPRGTEFHILFSHSTLESFSIDRRIESVVLGYGSVQINTQYNYGYFDSDSWQQAFNHDLVDLSQYTLSFWIDPQTVPGGQFTYQLNDLIVKSSPYSTSLTDNTEYFINLVDTPSVVTAKATILQINNDFQPTPPFMAQITKTAGTGGETGGGGGGTGGETGGGGGGTGGETGGGGGGNSNTNVASPVFVGGKPYGSVSVDPTIIPIRVTIDGVEQPLPAGSVVKNTTTGQKFLKLAGGELSFAAISVIPAAEWSWSAPGATGWNVLQGF